MSILTELIAGGSGGYNGDITDPNKLPMFSAFYAYLKTGQTTQQNTTTVAFWSTEYPKIGSVGIATANDTYVTVADITGKGYLNSVIGLGASGKPTGTLSYIKITVDNVAYEFKAGLSDGNGGNVSRHRFYIGKYTGPPTISYEKADNLKEISNSYFDPGNYRHYKNNNIILSPYLAVGVITDFMNGFNNKDGLRFETSIKVECKVALLSTTNYDQYCGAIYNLDNIA